MTYYEFSEAEGKTVKTFKISTSGAREIRLTFEDDSILTVTLDLGFTARAQYQGSGTRRTKLIKSGPSLKLVQ